MIKALRGERAWFRGTALGVCLLLLGGCATKPETPLLRPEPAWQHRFEHPVAFHKLVDESLLVAGTTRHLFGIDPKTGRQLWRLRNVNATRQDVVDVPGEPFILVNDAAGGAFDDRGTYILAVDREDGSLHWESPVVPGRILQTRLDRERQRVYAVTVEQAHGDDTGMFGDLLPGKGLGSGFERAPEILALDLADGTQLWKRAFGAEVSMRPTFRAGVQTARTARVFDLRLYHPPALAGDRVCVTYAGIRCYAADTGEVAWSHEYGVREWDLGRSYPNPVVNESRLFAGDTERLYAFDPRTGEELWESDDVGRMPALIDGNIMLYARIGGRYFDIEEEEWEAHGAFGVAAFNKRNGNILWNYEHLDDSITNVLVVEPYLWVADERLLYALDRLDGTISVGVRHELEDAPTYVLLNEKRQIVLLSETEAAAYDRSSGERLWYHRYESPGPGAWKQFAGALLSASGAIFQWSSAVVAHGSDLLPTMPGVRVAGEQLMEGDDVLESTTGALGTGLSRAGEALNDDNEYANLTGHTRYFITKLDYYDEIALAAVDLDSGQKLDMTVLPTQAANLVIDEVNGRSFQAEGQRLLAVPLGNREERQAAK